MAMRYKCEYVKEAGLAGIMYWEHAGDKHHDLFNAIYDHLLLY
jgi:chitinase